jgi:hypothetical protein
MVMGPDHVAQQVAFPHYNAFLFVICKLNWCANCYKRSLPCVFSSPERPGRLEYPFFVS